MVKATTLYPSALAFAQRVCRLAYILAAVSDAFKVALQASGLNETEYRRIVTAEIIDQKIKDKYTAEAPANVQQVKG